MTRSAPLMDMFWGGPERRITGLTLRIMGVNVAALIMLMIGVFYLSQYQESLIEAKLETFGTEVGLVSTALSAGADDKMQSQNMVRQLSLAMQQRIVLFDAQGAVNSDSYRLIDKNVTSQFRDARARPKYYTVQILESMGAFLLDLIPDRRTLPQYPDPHSLNAADYPDAHDAMNGKASISAWRDKEDIFLSAAAPVLKNGKFAGAVLVTRQAPDIENDIGEVWLNIIKAFLITLILMIILSIYLSGTIARPLKKLARAAENARVGHLSAVEIPDFSNRNDEIGELSIVLRDTTHALWKRMDSIEGFASDVAHELKNPLTSVRSAVETLFIIRSKKDQERLLQIIHQDVERMDRLITDISSVSRLDAELSRDTLEKMDLRAILHDLIGAYKDPLDRTQGFANVWHETAQIRDVTLRIETNHYDGIFIRGLESRFLQLFHNLIENALSFSPAGGVITIDIHKGKNNVAVAIRDQGPGIPENKLKAIFDRFYTERPMHEAYGRHSGLGLSICKQIIDALDGEIMAENLKDADGNIRGACFTIILNTVQK